MSRLLYSALLYILLPFTAIKLLWRGLRQPAYLNHWSERYGFYNQAVSQPIIWLHCVSVGETRAAKPLVERLLDKYPSHQILLSHATPTGREAGEQLFPPDKYPRITRCYLPYDTPDAVKRFFAPEFRNRLDAIIKFRKLEKDIMKKIVSKFLLELNTMTLEKRVEVQISIF
jgi:3-deoxy-D-manno-octulosonic-acid transferase